MTLTLISDYYHIWTYNPRFYSGTWEVHALKKLEYKLC